jgi:hypothetical protein
MSSGNRLAVCRFETGKLETVLEFLKRTRSELRTLRKARVSADRLQVFDVNGDWFEVDGLGYRDAEIVSALQAVNAAFNRESIHAPVSDEFKEFQTGRRYAWAADRVM